MPKGTKGHGSGSCLLPRMMTGEPGSITCPSEGTVAFQGAGSSRRQQARRPTERNVRRRAEAVPLPQVRLPAARGCQGVPCAKRMIPLERPDAVNPPVRFGERRLETEPWRGVRHRQCESRRQQLPPIRLPLPRQSPTLPFSATNPELSLPQFRLTDEPPAEPVWQFPG